MVNNIVFENENAGQGVDIVPRNIEVDEEFKEELGVKVDFELPVTMMGHSNDIVMPDGETVVIDDGFEPETIFSANAKCFSSDIEVPCPVVSSVSTKFDENGMRVQVNRNRDGDIETIKTWKMVDDDRVHSQSLQAVATDAFVEIPDEALDPEYWESFKMESTPFVGRLRRKLRGQVSADIASRAADSSESSAQPSKVGGGHRHRRLQCQEREIEVAVAIESSFCAAVGGPANARTVVENIMADVSVEYEMTGLCMKVTISHYEEHCDPANDPYKPGVDLNQSGCGSSGLLQFFQNYWNANRQGVQRDLAELFSGTGLECNGGCVIGCAYVASSCNLSGAYGVNWVSYTTNAVGRSNLIAHEVRICWCSLYC